MLCEGARHAFTDTEVLNFKWVKKIDKLPSLAIAAGKTISQNEQ